MDKTGIESIKRIRDACDAIVQASEVEDAQAMETALGKFLLTLIQLGAMKQRATLTKHEAGSAVGDATQKKRAAGNMSRGLFFQASCQSIRLGVPPLPL